MPNKQSIKRALLIPLISVFALLTICYLSGALPYTIYLTKARNATPILDQLNQKTLQQIPPPQGVALFESKIIGNVAGEGDGRWLELTYNKNSAARSVIYQYYLSSLSTAQWKVDAGVTSTISQIFAEKGSSCVEIRIFDDSIEHQYQVSIWQDLKQFVGSIPQDNIWFEESITHCP